MPAHVDGIGHHHNQRSSRIRLLPAVLVLLAIAGLPCVTLAQDAAPAPLLSADVFKSFYRPDVTVRYRLNLPEDQLAERRLVATVRPEGGTDVLALKEISPPAAEGAFSVSTEALPIGRYAIDLALLDANGAEAAQAGVSQSASTRYPAARRNCGCWPMPASTSSGFMPMHHRTCRWCWTGCRSMACGPGQSCRAALTSQPMRTRNGTS